LAANPQLDNKHRIIRIGLLKSGSNSVVECDLAKVEVASSNLVSRSKIFKDEGGRMKDESTAFTALIYFILPPSLFIPPKGGVAKW
jgi:hypothetical protein